MKNKIKSKLMEIGWGGTPTPESMDPCMDPSMDPSIDLSMDPWVYENSKKIFFRFKRDPQYPHGR